MNPAARHIVLWHLKRCGISEAEIEILMGAMSKGYELGQLDAMELVRNYIQVARTSAADLEDREIIETMYRLHRHYEGLDRDERVVDALMAARAILETKTSSPFSDRIVRAKLLAIESELARVHNGPGSDK